MALFWGIPIALFGPACPRGRGLGALDLLCRGLACLPACQSSARRARPLAEAARSCPKSPQTPRDSATRWQSLPQIVWGWWPSVPSGVETLRRCARSRASKRYLHDAHYCPASLVSSMRDRRNGSFVSSCGLDSFGPHSSSQIDWRTLRLSVWDRDKERVDREPWRRSMLGRRP